MDRQRQLKRIERDLRRPLRREAGHVSAPPGFSLTRGPRLALAPLSHDAPTVEAPMFRADFINSMLEATTGAPSPLRSAMKPTAPPNVSLGPSSPPPQAPPSLVIDTDAPPTQQRRQLADWVQTFNRDAVQTMPAALAIEAMHQQIAAQTADHPRPSALRTVAALFLLQRLGDSIERHRALFRTLTADITDGLFVPLGTTDDTPAVTYDATTLDAAGIDPMHGFTDLLSRQPYFAAYGTARERERTITLENERVEWSRGARGRVLTTCAHYWQHTIVQLCFKAWRGVVERESASTVALAAFVRRYDDRDRILTHFYAWRFASVQGAAERARWQLMDGVDAVAQREAKAHSRASELEDELDEMRLAVSRLKEQHLGFDDERSRLHKHTESVLFRAEEWRGVATDGLQFLGRLQHLMAAPRAVTGEAQPETADLAVQVVLGWVRRVIAPLPTAAKARLTNFGSDLKDGAVYLMLLHQLLGPAVSLDTLQHRDATHRWDTIGESIKSLRVVFPVAVEELQAGVTDAHFTALFMLWWHYDVPPPPEEPDTSVREFREDIEMTRAHLSRMAAVYPEWAEHRAVLMPYAVSVMSARLRGRPAKVIAADEEQAQRTAAATYALPATVKVPDVFLDSPFLPPAARQRNSDERERVNDLVAFRVQLVREVHLHYAKVGEASEPQAGTSIAVSESPSPKKKSKKKKSKEEEVKPETRLDFVGFYRFCEDCRVVAKELSADVSVPHTPQQPTDAALPPGKKISKAQLYQLFKDAALQSSPTKTTKASAVGLREVSLNPVGWTAALARVAVLRYAAPALQSHQAPAEAAAALERFLNADVAPFACNSATAFEQELWSPGTQAQFAKHRSILVPFFELFAGIDGDGTMNYSEAVQALHACGLLGGRTSIATVREIFAAIVGVKEDETTFTMPPGFSFARSSLRRASEFVADPLEATTRSVRSHTSRRSSHKKAAQKRLSFVGDPQVGLEDDESVDSSEQSVEEEPAMVYGEFEQFIATLAVYSMPSPHIPLDVKLSSFLTPFIPAATAALAEASKATAEHVSRRSSAASRASVPFS